METNRVPYRLTNVEGPYKADYCGYPLSGVVRGPGDFWQPGHTLEKAREIAGMLNTAYLLGFGDGKFDSLTTQIDDSI
ncbi:hypothetical protein RsoM2USA_272 [Ralstonia phage RsoM2USA]|nr:hypothetical protein RsoM2USA_272 [Ralstonia phage RsoM2USA]